MSTQVKIAAWKERSSVDNMTGEEGILRDEWRVRKVGEFTREDLEAAWGPDWHRYKPFATHVLEHRYIRRGTEEPWKPFDAANDRKSALLYIDDSANPFGDSMDGRMLIGIQEARQARAEAEKAEVERKRREEAEAEEREYHRKRSKEAFHRLRESKSCEWAERWNRFVTNAGGEARDRVAADRRLYDAVLAAETVPAKRKAIRMFLAAFGDGREEKEAG